MNDPEAEARVLGDVLARERRSNRPALRSGDRELDARRFITTAWKAGNYLRHLGVRAGSTVGVVGRTPEAVLTLFGAAALGAAVRMEPSGEDEFDVLVAPTERLDEFSEPARSDRVGYGAEPEDPAISYFERDVWSENPVEPPEQVSPEDAALVTDEGESSHATVMDAARDAVVAGYIDREDTVAVRAALADPRVVAAGVVAPLLVEACVLLPTDGQTGTVAVAEGDAPEDRTVSPAR